MEAITEKVYVEIPKSDLALLENIAQEKGWNIKTRDELIERYINTYKEMAELSEEEIMEEIRKVRYITKP